jgi:hypothetical protein
VLALIFVFLVNPCCVIDLYCELLTGSFNFHEMDKLQCPFVVPSIGAVYI